MLYAFYFLVPTVILILCGIDITSQDVRNELSHFLNQRYSSTPTSMIELFVKCLDNSAIVYPTQARILSSKTIRSEIKPCKTNFSNNQRLHFSKRNNLSNIDNKILSADRYGICSPNYIPLVKPKQPTLCRVLTNKLSESENNPLIPYSESEKSKCNNIYTEDCFPTKNSAATYDNNCNNTSIVSLDNERVELITQLTEANELNYEALSNTNGLKPRTPELNSFTEKVPSDISQPQALDTFEMTDSTIEVSGVINHYTPVIDFGNDCNTLIYVKHTSGFSVGDKVLLIQMQGAQIIEDNNENYGVVTNYQNAGNHEFSRIKAINGNVIELQNRLLYKYFVPGKVQLVRVPEFENVIVNRELTCTPWDGEIGGVLAFVASGNVTLKSNLNVTGKGFRGAKAISTNDHPYYYVGDYIVEEDRPGYSAPKGEGIAFFGNPPYINGRGAAANGGGGGGNHNTGGAGGANAGCGGDGSLGWVSTHYSGDNAIAQSKGGHEVEYKIGRIFLGGGGGAGHSNQDDLGHGGNGGGIVIVRAENIVSNNFSIIANGNDGVESTIDGSGGGGAGGAIFLDVNTSVEKLMLSAAGGNGANNNYNRYDIPPGGGGGGGAILFKKILSKAETNVEPGKNGVSASSGTDYGAKSGCRGFTIDNIDIGEGNPVSIGGTRKNLPNQYYKVESINNDKINLAINQTAEFCPGDKFLIIQMQGVQISTQNNENYGKIENYKSAGNFELVQVSSVNGNNITLQNPLVRDYEPNGKVQLVTVPEFTDFTVSNTLSCRSWDGELGGVLIFSVDNTLRLNASIDVSGVGFRGGKSINSPNNPDIHNDEYHSKPDSSRYALKGEGIFGWDIPEHLAGRGKSASGGGGGNNHNAGGGGGSNIGCGGNGGYGWALYNGIRETSQGLGGIPLNTDGKKLFFGGGGGAGHSNEFTGSDGGSGGGIVIIKAKTIVSDNQSIVSKGLASRNAAFDGVGGGGAGGSILLDCQQFINTLYLNVNGGSGGSTTDHRDGPGGGGGGGLIGLSINQIHANIFASVDGGGAGNNKDFKNDGATNGCPGMIKNALHIPGDTSILSSIILEQNYTAPESFVYPNPVSNTLVLAVDNVNSVEIFNSIGYKHIVEVTQSTPYLTVDVSTLSNGLYFIKAADKICYFIVSH